MENPIVLELKKVFEDRALRNPRYSMRAFSRDLQVDPSVLSKVIRGKRSVSGSMIRKMGRLLGLPADQVQSFQEKNKLHQKRMRDLAAEKSKKFVNIPLDQYEVIAHWIHLAILECLNLADFDHTPKYLAQRLGVSESMISLALARLKNVGVLDVTAEGMVQSQPINTSSLGPAYTTQAMRNQQRELLEKAIFALEAVPFELRSQSSLTIAIEKRKLPEFIERIHKFRRDMNGLMMKKSKKPDDIYCLSLSLFPLTATEAL
ncbi:TIGR02147 family protein [Bdellovibrio sp. ArHS]|uniref:TIGR02147 family protein n=1 Tax=Bdellovibrio sp. ArHS TaxID=1569284 RepID=UPI000B11F268|nr:TIGR02147 family protein [Bdellovibrio sp. ArHS]